jgi:prepilin-type N-terminal cleavage/methylation domain-containing protein
MKTFGFSLLELSIVLVIIGLLAGGVMVGQDLVQQAELRSVLTDMNKVQTSVNAFRNKYNALPGDMNNATAYWGTATTCPATSVAPLLTQATCNGNGNATLNASENNATSPEWWLFWEHLANAGLFEGSFSGASVTAATAQARPATNVPETRVTGVGMTVISLSMTATNNASWWFGSYPLMVVIGAEATNSSTTGAAFTPTDTNSIDQKIDDGRPGMGIIRTLKNTNCVLGVTSTSSQSAAVYDLTQQTRSCTLTYNILGGNPGVGN